MAASGVSVERLDVALQSSCRALGVESLKEHQREVIEYFVKGDDVLVCLPTGYGKSLCFAILPLVFDHLRGHKGSIVICVSPLTSLMIYKCMLDPLTSIHAHGNSQNEPSPLPDHRVLCKPLQSDFFVP